MLSLASLSHWPKCLLASHPYLGSWDVYNVLFYVHFIITRQWGGGCILQEKKLRHREKLVICSTSQTVSGEEFTP